ncbi:hypothetical protein WA026_003623 [Henosepilachna vigintioctopunctata]|uniref:Alpha-endosulfine n=1 Tax=Henosepilachna vigintioctopunctata TaxID=420089 RepID=A0AAW1TJT9_9CUCU
MSEQEAEQHEQEAPALSPQEAERQEEAKLKAKYPVAGGVGPTGRLMGGHSAFLQKRLAKGQKYFDSGDYQMAKQRKDKLPVKAPLPINPFVGTGEAIPTPDTIPVRKTSIMQSTKFTPNVS